MKDSIARRTSTGTIQAADGISNSDVATISQVYRRDNTLREEINSKYFKVLNVWGKVSFSTASNVSYWTVMSFLIDSAVTITEDGTIELNKLARYVYGRSASFISGILSLYNNGAGIALHISNFIVSSGGTDYTIYLTSYEPGSIASNPFTFRYSLKALADSNLGTSTGYLKCTANGGVNLGVLTELAEI